MPQLDQSAPLTETEKAVVRDRRRAHRIRTAVQEAVDVPIPLFRDLLADASPTTRDRAQLALGPKTFAALALGDDEAPRLADAS